MVECGLHDATGTVRVAAWRDRLRRVAAACHMLGGATVYVACARAGRLIAMLGRAVRAALGRRIATILVCDCGHLTSIADVVATGGGGRSALRGALGTQRSALGTGRAQRVERIDLECGRRRRVLLLGCGGRAPHHAQRSTHAWTRQGAVGARGEERLGRVRLDAAQVGEQPDMLSLTLELITLKLLRPMSA